MKYVTTWTKHPKDPERITVTVTFQDDGDGFHNLTLDDGEHPEIKNGVVVFRDVHVDQGMDLTHRDMLRNLENQVLWEMRPYGRRTIEQRMERLSNKTVDTSPKTLSGGI